MGAFLQIFILSCRPFTVDKFPHTYFIVQKTRLIPAHLYLLTIALEEAYNFYTLFYLVGATFVINTTLSTCIVFANISTSFTFSTSNPFSVSAFKSLASVAGSHEM